MKRIFFALALLGGITTVAQAADLSTTPVVYKVSADWVKSKTQTWAGSIEDNTYWYKLDKSAKLWWSTDGTKWAEVESQSWTDKDGKWLKIHEGKLVWSTDGTQWSEVPEWKWEGSDGKWYKFDKKWTLWTNK
ncbi:hypothetical protein U0035_18485 [Niabella yanshanensis]|uniref:WWE domain-containing protein n=1 Tax=Niabella yanshanensis TaxID=577386 RepID=A0ABZ0W572_9BACT|nr:hypothetical protein [Niabella yanshanensis]WQD37662.1 hypothetical protein U0035_18485 [Niabella yanshanensis]